MDLLDRYLDAVQRHLPWDRQDDILAELRANLESQLEDKEEELGRPLTKEEAEAWLKKIGPPIQVAGRYKPQQYLIGPAFFPMYWFVLRVAVLWVLAIYLVANAIKIAVETPSFSAVAEALWHIPEVLLTMAASITLVFAVLEFAAVRNPSLRQKLTQLDSLQNIDQAIPPQKKRPSLANAIAEVVAHFVMLVWLLLIPEYPFVLLGPGVAYLKTSPFVLTPVWMTFFWWVVALNALQLAWRGLDLWSGSWRQPNPLQKIVFKVFGAIPAVVLLSAPDHACIALRDPGLDTAHYGAALNTINQAIYKGLLVVCAVVVLLVGWEIVSMGLKAYRRRVAATH